jgi:hypothetical protein
MGGMTGPRPALSDWEIREIVGRAESIFQEHPPRRGQWRDGRYSRLEWLAREYGITRRTLYRYLRRAA